MKELAADRGFVADLSRFAAQRNADLEEASWFAQSDGALRLAGVAYFSMEFGIGEALPVYAGGLGILAGDVLKTASDLGVPIVGVGLLYQEGYFRQVIDVSGWQHEAYPYNEPAMLPIQPAQDRDGGWLHISLDLPGRKLVLRVWKAQVGRTALYLLDSNEPLNTPADRGLTTKLYAGGSEMRLMQEIILGIAGCRVIEALHREIEVCHINEGHAAFVVLERARSLARRTGLRFWEAFWAARAGNVFTTHTAVDAAFDRFDSGLIEKYLTYVDRFAADAGVAVRDLLALGRIDARADDEPFNMAFLALRGSLRAFGVSRLHAAQRPEFRRRVVFLEDYDISIAQELVQGVDVWINTPRRPWEACGTSRMEVLVNGGLNFSVLDGWWAEAYAPGVGWAIGDQVAPEEAEEDERDAQRLYAALEHQIIPEFYARDASGMPRRWLERVRKSMAVLTPAYAGTRMIREYLLKAYQHGADEFSERLANEAKAAKSMALWEQRVQRSRASVRLGDSNVGQDADDWVFKVPVYLGKMVPDDVRVELYADSLGADPVRTVPLERAAPICGAANGYIYVARVPASRPTGDFTARVIAYHPGACLPMEMPFILWQR